MARIRGLEGRGGGRGRGEGAGELTHWVDLLRSISYVCITTCPCVLTCHDFHPPLSIPSHLLIISSHLIISSRLVSSHLTPCLALDRPNMTENSDRKSYHRPTNEQGTSYLQKIATSDRMIVPRWMTISNSRCVRKKIKLPKLELLTPTTSPCHSTRRIPR